MKKPSPFQNLLETTSLVEPEGPEAFAPPRRPSLVEEHTPTDILTTRQTTHGDFAENARISQSIKEICRNSPGWIKLSDIEREAMDMIALKFSRILSGKSLEKQHWEDVVGYGRLVEQVCK